MSEWISVEDSVPTEYGWVLVWSSTFGQRMAVYQVDQCKGNAAWFSGNGKTIDTNKNEITHWMPLPEPPKPEGPFKVIGVGVGNKGWAINTDYSHSDARYVSCVLGQANRLCDWLNKKWAERKP